MNTGGALIDTRELDAAMRNVSAPRPVLLDVRWRLGGPPPAELYASGHLPGAVAVDLDRDLAAPVGDGRGDGIHCRSRGCCKKHYDGGESPRRAR